MIVVHKSYQGVLSNRQRIEMGQYLDGSPRLYGLDSWLIEAGYATRGIAEAVSIDGDRDTEDAVIEEAKPVITAAKHK